MDATSLSPYANPAWHAEISKIIRQTSTNQVDVRDAVLDGVDLSFARTILDLGCGFGFMTEAIARRAAATTPIVGVDACAANERPYLERIAATGRPARFVCRQIDKRLDWPDDSFDLIVASYALYFFPDVLPEVARVLTPAGLFIAVTHAEDFCRDLTRIVGLRGLDSRLAMLIASFSSENAADLLARCFEQVERVDYQNTLSFGAPQETELLTYLRFKLPLLWPDAQAGAQLPAPAVNTVRASLSRHGHVALSKNDAIFRCKRPRCL